MEGLPATVYIHPIATEQTMALRHAVLWPDKDISYVCLPEDDQGFHFGAFLPEFDHPACILSLFVERLPAADGSVIDKGHENKAVRFRKFACDPDYQGRGIGTKMLEHIFAIATSLWGAEVVWCDARATTADWYQKRGMATFGTPFFKGSLEYIRMLKRL